MRDMRMGTVVKSFTCLDSPIMGSTNHAFDGGQSQGNTPYLLMICLLTGAHGRLHAADVHGVVNQRCALRGDLHGFQVHRHHPHHSPSFCSFWEQDWSILQTFYGFTDLRGGRRRRGRRGRASQDQVTAGVRPQSTISRPPLRDSLPIESPNQGNQAFRWGPPEVKYTYTHPGGPPRFWVRI